MIILFNSISGKIQSIYNDEDFEYKSLINNNSGLDFLRVPDENQASIELKYSEKERYIVMDRVLCKNQNIDLESEPNYSPVYTLLQMKTYYVDLIRRLRTVTLTTVEFAIVDAIQNYVTLAELGYPIEFPIEFYNALSNEFQTIEDQEGFDTVRLQYLLWKRNNYQGYTALVLSLIHAIIDSTTLEEIGLIEIPVF